VAPRDPDSWDDPRAAESYAEIVAGGVLYRALAGILVDLLEPRPAERILDLAAGTGIVAERLLARAGPEISLVLADGAAAMLRVAASRFPPGIAGTAVVTPAALPFREAVFDAGACSAALWHFVPLARCLAEIARVLRPGGRFAWNVPAAQLADVPDLPPAPLQVALAREGERRFGREPAPAGPVRRREDLLAQADEAGLELVAERLDDVPVPVVELAALVRLPPFGGRLYPGVPVSARDAWVDASLARVDAREASPVRWWSCVVRRRPGT